MPITITLPMLEKYGLSRETKCTVCVLTKYVKLVLLNEFGKTQEELKTKTFEIVLSNDVVSKTKTTLNHVGMRDKDCSFIFRQEAVREGNPQSNTGGG